MSKSHRARAAARRLCPLSWPVGFAALAVALGGGRLSAAPALEGTTAAASPAAPPGEPLRAQNSPADGGASTGSAASPARASGPATAAGAASAADSAGDANSAVLSEVVVTAQFRAQNVQNTAIAITAENAAMIEARGQTSVLDVGKEAPNVTIEPTPQGFGNSAIFSIRGISQTDFSFALEPGVGTYIDDVYFSTVFGSEFDLLDLDRVEILRGPQGTLAGKNSIGGAVKLYSIKPDDSGGGYLEATTGSYGRLDLRGSGDVVLVPGQLFLRLSGISEQRDGYMTRYDYACTHPGSGYPSYSSSVNCVLGTEGGLDEKALRAALRWIATDRLELNLIIDGNNDQNEAPASSLLYVGPNVPPTTLNGTSYAFGPQFVTNNLSSYATFTDPTSGRHFEPVSTDKGFGVSGTIDWQLANELSVKSITAYREYSGEFGEDLGAAPLAVEYEDELLHHRQFTEEVRLNGSALDHLLDYTLGGFYFDSRNYLGGEIDIPAFGDDFLQNDTVPSSSKAGFLQTVWHLTDKLNLSAGTRYTSESKTYTFGRLDTDGTVPSGLPGTENAAVAALNGVTGRYADERWDYRGELDYQWTADLMTYAEYSTGFKGGGVNPRPFVATQEVPFGPETLDAYEIGVKSQFLDRRLRVNLSAFYNEYDSIQETAFTCPALSPVPDFPCSAVINAGNGIIKGVEAEIEAHPTAALELDASASSLDFHYTSVSTATTGITKADQLPYAPKYRGSLGVQYDIGLGSLGSLTPRLDLSSQSQLYASATNSPLNRIGGYTLVNGRLTWRPDAKWEVAAFVTNLTNKMYIESLFDLSTNIGIVYGMPAPPREWGLSIKLKL